MVECRAPIDRNHLAPVRHQQIRISQQGTCQAEKIPRLNSITSAIAQLTPVPKIKGVTTGTHM